MYKGFSPCPFCGNPRCFTLDGIMPIWNKEYICGYCPDCGAQGKRAFYSGKQEKRAAMYKAREYWNHRAHIEDD